MTKASPIRDRLLSRLLIDLEGSRPVDDAPCWIWQGALTNGYGTITRGGGRGAPLVRTHIAAWEIFRGTIPRGMQIDHLCRVRSCCNPAHLEPVTQKVNILRGESLPARNARKTHCDHGHEYSLENTYRSSEGYRVCRTCRRIWDRARAPRRKRR